MEILFQESRRFIFFAGLFGTIYFFCYEGRNIWSDLDRQIDFGTQNTSGLLVYAVL